MVGTANGKNQTERHHQIEVSGEAVIVLKKRGDAPFPCRYLRDLVLDWVEQIIERSVSAGHGLPKPEERHGDG